MPAAAEGCEQLAMYVSNGLRSAAAAGLQRLLARGGESLAARRSSVLRGPAVSSADRQSRCDPHEHHVNSRLDALPCSA